MFVCVHIACGVFSKGNHQLHTEAHTNARHKDVLISAPFSTMHQDMHKSGTYDADF